MFVRVKHMLIKEFIQVFRDPRMKAVIFVLPIVQVLVFGYAVTTDVQHVATALYDLDQSVESRDLVSRFTRSGYFRIVAYVETDQRVRELLDHGTVSTVLRFNKGFAADLRAGRTAILQMLLDGTDSNTIRIVLNYASRIVEQRSEQLMARRLTQLANVPAAGSPPTQAIASSMSVEDAQDSVTESLTPANESHHLGAAATGAADGRGRLPQVRLDTRAWFNENLESRNFYVPGVIAMMVMLVTLLLTSMAVVREKEIGTMEQIIVTPITPHEFILGKTLPFALIALVIVILVTGFGVFWFGVPVRGSLLLLLGASALYLLTALGVGLFISTVSHTQQQAMMGTFFFFFPASLLSGFMFPIANMPVVVQWITYVNPLRYFLVIVRGIFLKGVGVSVLWPQMAALLVIGVVSLALASSRFRKTIA
jgi:ABC-2 type transport system permease protein